jgi:hypothetical protein
MLLGLLIFLFNTHSNSSPIPPNNAAVQVCVPPEELALLHGRVLLCSNCHRHCAHNMVANQCGAVQGDFSQSVIQLPLHASEVWCTKYQCISNLHPVCLNTQAPCTNHWPSWCSITRVYLEAPVACVLLSTNMPHAPAAVAWANNSWPLASTLAC